MTIALAQEYIRGRMGELGFSDQYYIRLRHYVVRPKEILTIDADTQFFVMIQPPVMIRVQSEYGIFDLTVDNVNELQYEHWGKIEIENYASHLQHVQFIQVILKTNENAADRKQI